MRAVVTGGAGFIGAHVVDRLLARGDDVTVIDVATPRVGNGAEAAARTDVRHVEASVLDAAAMDRHLRDAEVVVHLAGLVRAGIRERPYDGGSLQLQGTLNVLEACRANEVPRLGFASSFYVYDGIPAAEDVDESTPLDPLGMELFGSVKLMGEALCRRFAEVDGPPATCFRIGPAYGPGGSSAVADFIEMGLRGEVIDIWGSGERRNQYTYVGDIADALVAGLDHPDETYNLVAPDSVSIRELTDLLAEEFGFEATFDPARPEGPSFPYISSDKARDELGWEPLDLREGVRRTAWAVGEELELALPGQAG